MATENKIDVLIEQIDSNKYQLGELFIEFVYYHADLTEALKQFDVFFRMFVILQDTLEKAKKLKNLEAKQQK